MRKKSEEKDSTEAGSCYNCSTDTRRMLQPVKVEDIFSALSPYNLHILSQS